MKFDASRETESDESSGARGARRGGRSRLFVSTFLNPVLNHRVPVPCRTRTVSFRADPSGRAVALRPSCHVTSVLPAPSSRCAACRAASAPRATSRFSGISGRPQTPQARQRQHGSAFASPGFAPRPPSPYGSPH
eukprot:scaffold83533_cov63-Phaeocystis_antarctica.AAC.1